MVVRLRAGQTATPFSFPQQGYATVICTTTQARAATTGRVRSTPISRNTRSACGSIRATTARTTAARAATAEACARCAQQNSASFPKNPNRPLCCGWDHPAALQAASHRRQSGCKSIKYNYFLKNTSNMSPPSLDAGWAVVSVVTGYGLCHRFLRFA